VKTIRKRIRVCLAGSAAVIRRISLPIMTHAELKDAIRYEAERHLPFAVDECVLDFQILNQIPHQSVMNVLLVAAQRSVIEAKLSMLGACGVTPESLDIDLFCLSNAFELFSDRTPADKSYALLNIGHRSSLFVIVHETFPHYLREIPCGSLQVTQALADLKGIAEPEADRIKVEKPQAESSFLRQATEKGFERLVEEIKTAVDAFEAETAQKLSWTGLSGGGCGSQESESVLSAALGCRVSRWEASSHIKSGPHVVGDFLYKHSDEMSVCLGMAAAALGRLK
ncbi:MAG: pilus assembly protein PilM, partial [Candidatus Omnitrophota bacterium]